jgi:hypothetical protein
VASQIAAIADAVKTALNDAVADETLSMTFAAERLFVPYATLEALEDLHVYVMPVERVVTKRDRGELQSDVRVDVAVIKRIEADPKTEAANAELDPLLELVEEIVELFGRGEYGGARWLATENPGLFDIDRLNTSKTFLSLVTLTFKLF